MAPSANDGGVGAQGVTECIPRQPQLHRTCCDRVDSEEHARAVLGRFARNVIATRWLRRELFCCRALGRAFTASDPQSPRSTPRPLLLVSRRGGSCSNPEPDSRHDGNHHQRQQWHDADQNREHEDADGNESGSSSGFSQRATIETVVHNLYVKLEAATRSECEKDERIRMLELRVAALERENRVLRATDASSQVHLALKTASERASERASELVHLA